MSIIQHHEFALTIAPHAAAVANYCDHIEHNEPAATEWVIEAGEWLTDTALQFASGKGLDLIQLYGERLRVIEAGNVLARSGGFSGHGASAAAATWRELQLVQSEHDRVYHPDVVGLARLDQLRHYALHLTKIVGAFARSDSDEELHTKRLPDTLLFAIKLRTVMGHRMADDPLP